MDYNHDRVLVTGANGYVGSNLITLLSADLHIIGITRAPYYAPRTKYTNVLLEEFLQSDTKLSAFCEGATLIHLIGSGRDTEANSIRDSNIRALASVLRLRIMKYIKKIIYLSGYGVRKESSVVYYRTKAMAEEMVAASGVDYAILRSSYIVGGRDELVPEVIRRAKEGEVSIPGDGSYAIQPVYIGDIAAIIEKIVRTEERVALTVDVLGEEITVKEFMLGVTEHITPKPSLKFIDLADLIREATFNADPWFSLSELAILVANKTGVASREVVGVELMSLRELLERCKRDGGNTV